VFQVPGLTKQDDEDGKQVGGAAVSDPGVYILKFDTFPVKAPGPPMRTLSSGKKVIEPGGYFIDIDKALSVGPR